PPPPRATLFPYTTLFRSEYREGQDIAGILRNGGGLANLKQLLQGEADGQKQRVDLETVERPAEVRGNQHLPLLAVEGTVPRYCRSEEHTSELQSRSDLVC